MAKTPEERQASRKVKPGPVQRLAALETALADMNDDAERCRAIMYFAAHLGMRCEPCDKIVPGTNLRVGDCP